MCSPIACGGLGVRILGTFNHISFREMVTQFIFKASCTSAYVV